MPALRPALRTPAICLALAAVFLFSGISGAKADSGNFDIYLRGIKAGSLAFNGVIEGRQYSVAGRIKTSGFVRALIDFRFDAQARGRLSGDRFIPSEYSESVTKSGRKTEFSMRYNKGIPQTPEFTPKRRARPFDIAPSAQKNTLDPMTAIFSLLRDVPKSKLCTLDIAIYEGRRRVQLTLSDRQEQGTQVFCSGEIRRVAGFNLTEMAQQVLISFTLTYFDLGNEQFQLSKIVVPTRYGTVSMNRR